MSVPKSLTRIFIDESGTPERYIPAENLEHDRFVTMAAAIIEGPDYATFKKEMEELHGAYSEYLGDKEIKSRYIRRSNPSGIGNIKKPPPYTFYKFPGGQNIYDSFCADLKDILLKTPFLIISTTTNKELAQIKYPRLNFHRVLLYDLWERISIYHKLNGCKKMRIVFDRSKSNFDLILKESYSEFKENGTWYFNDERLNSLNLERDVYSCESEDSWGIQLVDLCAHPIKKYIEHGRYPFFDEIIKKKLHRWVIDKKTNTNINMGTKVTLN